MDLSGTIIPNSQQLNAEDLLSHPETVTVADVKKGSAEQPVDIHLVEFPGRPFRPSKTVRRILVNAWGADAATYVGRRMTLYRDPAVKFGGMDVGGIRVSHLSHIEKPLSVALTVSRGKRQAYVVKPLADITPAPVVDAITRDQQAEMTRMFTALGLDRDERKTRIEAILGRAVKGPNDLTRDEAQRLIAAFELELGEVS